MDPLTGNMQSVGIPYIVKTMEKPPTNLHGVLSRFYKSCMINLINIITAEAYHIGHDFNSIINIDDPTNIHLKGFIRKAIEKTSRDFGLVFKSNEINELYKVLKTIIKNRLQDIQWNFGSIENLRTILTRDIDLDCINLMDLMKKSRSLKNKFLSLLNLSAPQWKSILSNVKSLVEIVKTAPKTLSAGKTSALKGLFRNFLGLFKKNTQTAAAAKAVEEVAEEAASTLPHSRNKLFDIAKKSGKGGTGLGLLGFFLDLRGTSHAVTLSDIDYAKKECEFVKLGITPEAHFKAYEFFNSRNVTNNTRVFFDIKADPIKYTNAYLSLATAFESYDCATGKKYVITKKDWQKISAIYLTLSVVAKTYNKPLKFSASQLAHVCKWYKDLTDYEFKKRYPLMPFLIGYINSDYNVGNTAELEYLGIKNLEKIEGGFSTGDLLLQIAFKKNYEIYQLNKNLKIQKNKPRLD